MAEHIAIVQPRHRDLRHDHLEEGREGRKDAKLVGLEAKARCSGEVTALHDPRRNEHLGMFLMDHLQTSRTLEITCASMSASHRISKYRLKTIRTIDDHDFLRSLFFGEPIKYNTHGFSKHNAIRIVLTRRADV